MFSIVIPLYNKEFSIRGTILSVLNQTFGEFEVVVVNDGSTDNSLEVVKGIRDSRVRVINQKNQGVSAARNRGIAEAQFEWVAFLDGDDLWRHNHLEVVLEMMRAFPTARVYVTSFEYSDKRPVRRNKNPQPASIVANYFKEAVKGGLMWTGAVVMHKCCIDKVGAFNDALNRGEDLDLWARLAREFDIVKSPDITAEYVIYNTPTLTSGRSDYDRSVISTVNLEKMRGYERKYFKRMVLKRLGLELMALNVAGITRILKTHRLNLIK